MNRSPYGLFIGIIYQRLSVVITNDAAIPTHLGHDSTAPPVKCSYSHYDCVCVCATVCVLLSVITPLQVQVFFHRAPFLLLGCYACGCMCVLVDTMLFAQLQAQHSPLIHPLVALDKHTQSCYFFSLFHYFIVIYFISLFKYNIIKLASQILRVYTLRLW